MTHNNTKEMMFYFLQRIDYNQSWEEIEHDMGYDLGDFLFNKPGIQQKIIRLAKQNWIELPEEYKLIDTTTNIQGQYDPHSKTLKIWFNNNYKNS